VAARHIERDVALCREFLDGRSCFEAETLQTKYVDQLIALAAMKSVDFADIA